MWRNIFMERVLWAKLKQNKWISLQTHMTDAAEVAKLLWSLWLPLCTKKRISEGIAVSEEEALSCFIFLASVHDVGKGIPTFQCKINNFDILQQLSDEGFMR